MGQYPGGQFPATKQGLDWEDIYPMIYLNQERLWKVSECTVFEIFRSDSLLLTGPSEGEREIQSTLWQTNIAMEYPHV